MSESLSSDCEQSMSPFCRTCQKLVRHSSQKMCWFMQYSRLRSACGFSCTERHGVYACAPSEKTRMSLSRRACKHSGCSIKLCSSRDCWEASEEDIYRLPTRRRGKKA